MPAAPERRGRPGVLNMGLAAGAIACMVMLAFWPGVSGGFIFTGADSAAGDPFVPKLASLSAHAANALIVLFILRALFGLLPDGRGNETMRERARAFAFLGAALWALHPLHVSSVFHEAHPTGVYAHTGVLLALLSYLQARSRQLQGRPSSRWFVAAAVSFGVGLYFEAGAALVVGYFLMMELTLLRFHGAGRQALRPLVVAHVGLVVAGLGLYLVFVLPAQLDPSGYASRDFTLVERVATQFDVLRQHLAWALLPDPTRYVHFHDTFPVSQGLFSPQTLLSALILVAVLALAVVCRRRLPLVTLGVGWFFIAHVPTSSTLPLDLLYEHTSYFALLGLVLAGMQLLAWGGHRLNLDAGGALSAVAVIVVCLATLMHSHTWGDPLRLASTVATRNPESPGASYHLGRVLLESSRMDPNVPTWSMARTQFQDAARLAGSSILPEQAILDMDARAQRIGETHQWSALREKLTRRTPGPREIEALAALGQCVVESACQLDGEEFQNSLNLAREQLPDEAALLDIQAKVSLNVHNGGHGHAE